MTIVQKILPLPLDRPSFEFLSEKIKLPKSFLRSLERAGPVHDYMDIEYEEADPHMGIGGLNFTITKLHANDTRVHNSGH